MIKPSDIEHLQREVEDRDLARIESEMDKRIPEAKANGQKMAMLIIEDYPIFVRKRIPELVNKYQRNGWDCHWTSPDGHLIINL